MTQTAHEYARANAARFKQQLIDLLRIPSVSTMKQHAPMCVARQSGLLPTCSASG
ncbi:MAG: hypothetical protein U0694_09560 [Anaerolineae bacterium]